MTDRAKYLIEKLRELPQEEIHAAGMEIAGLRVKNQNDFVANPKSIEETRGDIALGLLHGLMYELCGSS